VDAAAGHGYNPPRRGPSRAGISRRSLRRAPARRRSSALIDLAPVATSSRSWLGVGAHVSRGARRWACRHPGAAEGDESAFLRRSSSGWWTGVCFAALLAALAGVASSSSAASPVFRPLLVLRGVVIARRTWATPAFSRFDARFSPGSRVGRAEERRVGCWARCESWAPSQSHLAVHRWQPPESIGLQRRFSNSWTTVDARRGPGTDGPSPLAASSRETFAGDARPYRCRARARRGGCGRVVGSGGCGRPAEFERLLVVTAVGLSRVLLLFFVLMC